MNFGCRYFVSILGFIQLALYQSAPFLPLFFFSHLFLYGLYDDVLGISVFPLGDKVEIDCPTV